MNNLTPEIQKGLRQIAGNLPVLMNGTQEFHWLTGRELKEMDIDKDTEGKPLVDDIKYRWAMPVQIAANHYRALKKAYQRNGEAGVIAYINKIGDLLDAETGVKTA